MKKVYKRCGKEKPIEEFGKYSANKDGHRIYCKECWREIVRIQYWNRKAKAIDKVEKTDSKIKVYSNADLAKFTPRQLMEELKARGFKWDCMLEPQRKIFFDKI